MSVPNDEFLAKIRDPKLAGDYRVKLGETSKKIRAQFRKNKKAIKIDLQQEISNYEAHDELLNMIIFPFLQKNTLTKMGYRLLYCDPLHEIGLQNYDVLIARFTDKVVDAIFIEAKTSDRHLPGLVDELIEKQRVGENNRQFILDNYLKTKLPTKFEYVICGYSHFIDNIQDAIEQKFSSVADSRNLANKKLIVWKVDRWESTLGIANPGKSNTYQRQMLHADNNLNTELSRGLVTSHRTMLFFPQSHIVSKLKSIVKMMISKKVTTGKSEFQADDVRNYLSKDLYYLASDMRNQLAKQILDVAEKIGIIQQDGFGSYNAAKEYSGSSLHPRTIEKLWIDYRIIEQVTKKIDEFAISIRKEIKSADENTRRLDEYIKKDNND